MCYGQNDDEIPSFSGIRRAYIAFKCTLRTSSSLCIVYIEHELHIIYSTYSYWDSQAGLGMFSVTKIQMPIVNITWT